MDVVTRKRSLVDAARTYLRTRGQEGDRVRAEAWKDEGAPSPRPSARYIGWAGHFNLGDEVMLDAVKELLPWADITTSGDPGKLLILGGGTLINRSSYLKQVTERDTPRIERVVLGTGVANPDFWGEQEDPERWVRWLSTCAYVGVRGPYSLNRLQSWGLDAGVEVCGDSALLIERPAVERVAGRVVIAPAWTKGRLWGGSDDAVNEALSSAIASLTSEGCDVVMLASSPDDDGQILQIGKRLNRTFDFVQGYLNQAEAIELIASSEVVVGERLHACVIAAAVGTPFVPIEYRPKLRDFAASVGVESLVIRSDELTGDALVRGVHEAIETGVDEITRNVDLYRSRLRAAAGIIERAVTA